MGQALGKNTPEELIQAGRSGQIELGALADITICWSPGKKGNQKGLKQAPFSVKDSVVTRNQLSNTPFLNRRAAECIIDFCPDLLWREILLRILSEGSYTNKDVRDRYCLNGCFSDRATVAKRLSAAMGKESNAPKSKKGKGKKKDEEDENDQEDGGVRDENGEKPLGWADGNRKDHADYQLFFGKKAPPIRLQKDKDKNKKRKATGDSSDNGEGPSKSSKQVKFDTPDTGSQPETASRDERDDDEMDLDDREEGDEEMGDAEEDDAAEKEADDDAVSAQNSDDLDELSD
jgi:hypothetical protein